MRMQYDGRELIVRNLDTARLRDIAELQRQTGWKMNELRDRIAEADILAGSLTIFLTLAAYDYEPKWEDLLDGTISALRMEQDPQDVVIAAESVGDVQDPPRPPSGSDPGGEPPAEGAPE